MVTPISSKSRIIFAHALLNQAYPIISGQLGSCTMLNQNKFIRILLLLSQDKALFQWIRRDVRLQDQPTRDIKPWAGTRPGLGLAGPDSEVGLALIPELWKALKLFLESSEQLWIHWFGSGFFGHIPNPLFPCVCLSDGAAYLTTFCRGRYSNPRQERTPYWLSYHATAIWIMLQRRPNFNSRFDGLKLSCRRLKLEISWLAPALSQPFLRGAFRCT